MSVLVPPPLLTSFLNARKAGVSWRCLKFSSVLSRYFLQSGNRMGSCSWSLSVWLRSSPAFVNTAKYLGSWTRFNSARLSPVPKHFGVRRGIESLKACLPTIRTQLKFILYSNHFIFFSYFSVRIILIFLLSFPFIWPCIMVKRLFNYSEYRC